MIRLLEEMQSYQQLVDNLSRPNLDINKLYSCFTRQEISDILSEIGLYMRFADISVRTDEIVIFCTAHISGVLTEAVLRISITPNDIIAEFEIPNHGRHTVSKANPSEWDYCVKAWNEVTVPDYQKNILRSQGYEFLS